MLESLYRLVVPLVRAKDDKELSKGTLIRESKAAQKSAAERRREIDLAGVRPPTSVRPCFRG